MKVSRKGARFVATFEAFVSCPYWDEYGKTWTIGYGETEGIAAHTPCTTESKARALLVKRLNGRFLAPVKDLGLKLKQQEVDALVCLVYNEGPGIVSDPSYSTLARRLQSSEAKTFDGRRRIYREELPKWNKSGGVVLAGLTRRRAAEVRLACRGDYSAA